MGSRRPAVERQRARVRREVLAASLRSAHQDADAGDYERTGLSRAGRSGTAAVHRAAPQQRAGKGARLSRRRTLGTEGAQQQTLARRSVRVAEEVPRVASGRKPTRPLRATPGFNILVDEFP